MSRKKLAVIIAVCIIAIIIVILAINDGDLDCVDKTYHTLITNTSPSGTGSVCLSPPGGEYESGVQVTLTANAAAGYIFGHWSGSESGTMSTITITMDSDKSITANFKTATNTLTVTISPWGAGSVSPPSGQYPTGTRVTLTAVPSSGYRFGLWSGDVSGTDPAISVTMNSNKNIIANFVRVVEARVTRVIDGDTIEVNLGGTTYKVRYIGIDTPETVHPSQPVECFGKQASDKNSELVAGKIVRLEEDISETDKYGRLLRYVWVGDIFVNDYLVRQGYAYASTYPPDVKYADQFAEAQSEAIANNRGLWAICE